MERRPLAAAIFVGGAGGMEMRREDRMFTQVLYLPYLTYKVGLLDVGFPEVPAQG